jgi:hypothetical protein
MSTVRHIVLPSTEGCEGGPLKFDLIMPPAAVINPLVLALYNKSKSYPVNKSTKASSEEFAAAVDLYMVVLKACTWPEGLGLEHIMIRKDLDYLLKVAADFIRSWQQEFPY